MRKRILVAISLLCTLFSLPALAFTHSESANGEISNISALPTAFTLENGVNTLVGSAGTLPGGSVSDYDIFTFSIAPNQVLISVVIDAYSNTDPDGESFFAVVGGSTWTAGLGSGILGSGLLGWDLINDSDIGQNVLPTLGIANQNGSGNGGFPLPLSPGNYTFLLQDTTTPFNYAFSFNVSSVPIPAALPMLISGLLGLFVVKNRRRKRVA